MAAEGGVFITGGGERVANGGAWKAILEGHCDARVGRDGIRVQ